MTFHDDKFWQEAYVACMDLLEATDGKEPADVVDQARKHAMMALTVTAQAVATQDRRLRDTKLRDVRGIVVSLRSLLSVLWAREAFDDETFGNLDGTYETLFDKLPK